MEFMGCHCILMQWQFFGFMRHEAEAYRNCKQISYLIDMEVG